MTEKLTLRISPKDDTIAKRETGTSSNLQLEKIKLPRFEGEIRAYTQFKRDFEKQIIPHLQSDNVSYVHAWVAILQLSLKVLMTISVKCGKD